MNAAAQILHEGMPGDHHLRRPIGHLQDPQRAGDELTSGCGVSAGRELHVDDLAVLVDGPG